MWHAASTAVPCAPGTGKGGKPPPLRTTEQATVRVQRGSPPSPSRVQTADRQPAPLSVDQPVGVHYQVFHQRGYSCPAPCGYNSGRLEPYLHRCQVAVPPGVHYDLSQPPTGPRQLGPVQLEQSCRRHLRAVCALAQGVPFLHSLIKGPEENAM